MHRHGYQGRKFGRQRDQRRALLKGLAESLVKNGSLVTTLPKAKDLRPYMERLVTKAKKGDLASRRQIISGLQTVGSAHRLVDEIAPRLTRQSGYLRIARASSRRGDNAQLATISFVDDLTTEIKPPAAAKSKKPAAKPAKTLKTPKTAGKRPAVKKAAGQ